MKNQADLHRLIINVKGVLIKPLEDLSLQIVDVITNNLSDLSKALLFLRIIRDILSHNNSLRCIYKEAAIWKSSGK